MKPDLTKPAVIFLAQRLPYPPVKGEKIASYNLVRHLARRYRVFVGTFVDDPVDHAFVDEFRGMVAGLKVVNIRKPWAFLRAAPRWLLGEPLTFALFRSIHLRRWLERVAREEAPVAVITYSSNISGYAVNCTAATSGDAPRVFMHFSDVDSEKFADYAKRASGPKRWLLELETSRVRREEQRLTSLAHHVALVSDEEAGLLRSQLVRDQDRVVTLPNGVDTDLFDPAREYAAPFTKRGPAFVFTGAMDYFPNIEAVAWFAREVFPLVRKQLPEAQFLIVGSKPTDEVRSLARIEGVTVTGRVDSVAAYLAHAQVAVAPLQIARGIQNKVLEAMSMAVPTIVSQGALTGISATHGKNVIRADSVAEWVEACIDLAMDERRARAIGLAGRKLVLEHYDWESQFRKLDGFLGLELQSISTEPR